eukprot:Hpha_TRINITY_DN15054_c2_g4::TRINITY_DN15054_c2_g4_i1::g.125951::m.125951
MAPSRVNPRRSPLPRFPLVILFLIGSSVLLFAVHFLLQRQLQPPPAAHPPPAPVRRGTDRGETVDVHGDFHRNREHEEQGEEETPTPALRTPTPSPPGPDPSSPRTRFRKLWPPAPWPREDGGRTEKDAEELIYEDARTPDPRGVPVPRHQEQARISDDTGRIWTADRRKTRVPLIIPPVVSSDLPEREGEREREWNIVIGIPSIDTDTGAKRRGYQRASWLLYNNVWDPVRNPKGTILVKYLLAYHPLSNYTLRPALFREARAHKDVLVFDMREGDPTPPPGWKKDKKPWRVEVGMSRKAYAWYCLVADVYKANWVIKGDDDEFMRTKFLEAELNALPWRERVYYGRVMFWGVAKGSSQKFPFSGGMSITMTWDLADWIRDSMYAEEGKEYYHEDVMVGRWFYLARVPLNVVRDCRHHDIHRGANKQKVTEGSVCIHHIQEGNEYLEFKKRFPDASPRPTPRRKTSTDAFGNTFMELSGGCKKG